MRRISFGREVTSQLEAALSREWLVTNGSGSYASGTVAMANTRRYHGLLVAALPPPLGCTLLVAKLEAAARIGVELFPLTTNEYIDGAINPDGFHNLESFRLEGTIPVFTWAVADRRLVQRIWMSHKQDTTFVTYTLVRASHPIAIEVIPLCTFREARAITDIRGWMPTVRPGARGVRVDASPDAFPYWLRTNRGTFVPGVVRHLALRHRADSYRGIEDREDLFAIGRLDAKLTEGETLAWTLTTDPDDDTDWQTALEIEKARQTDLVVRARVEEQPGWIHRLVLAADQFIVERQTVHDSSNKETHQAQITVTIEAGYPWLRPQSRDTLIALPGLALATGRPGVAASVLGTLADLIHEGMLPTHLPDPADPHKPLQFGAADVALWLFPALQYYLGHSSDQKLLRDLYPVLVGVLDWLVKGTRYGIRVDEIDGLLGIGEAPFALTWMNAQDGEHQATPRVGKPVELNALWYNALATAAAFARELNEQTDAVRWQDAAEQAAESFRARFWYENGGHLFDVVDGPLGDDAALRPNQIFAVSLPHSPIKDPEKAKSIVDVVARHLLTSYGVRTLSPRDPAYAPRYGGNQAARANAFHQGTVWAWLIGPFVSAYVKVYGDAATARSFLLPFADHLVDHGLGSISEVFDGEPPHTPRGCVASAAGVGQVLWSWLVCQSPQPRQTGSG